MLRARFFSGSSALLFVVAFCLLFPPVFGASSSMVLKENAVVSDNIVRVKDVAMMNADARSRIGDLVIAVSPELGASSSIARNEILEKLIGNGFAITSAQLKGAASVKVMRRGSVVKPNFFKSRLLNYIKSHSKWKEGLTLTIVTSKEIVIPESGVRWQLMPANGQDFFGNILFKVQAFSNKTNELLYSNWIVAKLEIHQRVAISNRTINKNEPIGSGDIRWESRKITALTKSAIFNEREILGEKAGRVIRPNTVITASVLRKKFMVRRGGIATLTATFKTIKASSRVKVLANGALGDTIRVINTQSRKILSATVTGKNRLEVTVE